MTAASAAYASRLVRFRADPSKVRVAVRKRSDHYVVTLEGGSVTILRYTRVPWVAVCRLLLDADDMVVPGVDIHCQWAYPHPWRKT